MTLKERLLELTERIEKDNTLINDPSLKKIVDVLRTVENVNDLKREKALINIIIVDSVENMKIGGYVLIFTKYYG